MGLSYSLSAVTVPSILALPSASDAVRAFENLTSSSTLQLRALTGISTASFLLAFFLSPRAFRLRYVVYKGFIAVDGASLTVTRVNDDEGWWEVMLISYTQEKVVTAAKKPGETVNVEVDMMAKYAEKSLAAYFGKAGAAATGTTIKDIAAQNQ
ncbi:hypothetical protein BN1723_000110 [Verticillium longisporum]|uniref:Riboflavin synthase n=1 Tax=Verticillium longisporum TaxID=100787 RepID=A0A0G4KE15_VERLO|nr:hypothetical protein BN1723_000110 [Verticillium longisporum]